MIDIDNEQLLTLKEAAARLPGQHGGTISYETIRRWAIAGIRGVRLETVRYGGHLRTSTEAVRRFFHQLTVQSNQPCAVESPEVHQKRARSARDILKTKYGIG